jgi:hypothetical protein
VVVRIGEETVYRRLEIGEGGKVLVVDRGFLVSAQPWLKLDFAG